MNQNEPASYKNFHVLHLPDEKKKTSYLCLFPSDCLSRLKFVWRFVRSFCFLHTGFLGILRSLGRGLGFFFMMVLRMPGSLRTACQ